MDAIALAAVAAVALLLLVALLVTGRGRTRARRRADSLERDISDVRSERDTALAGEREAVWAVEATTVRLDRAESAHSDALERMDHLATALDDLRTQLADADADLVTARADAERAHTEVARLEAELSTALAAELTDDGAPTEAQLAALTAELEAERAAVTRLRAEVDAVAAAEADDSYRSRLAASEARRRDLEDRLASLNSVRAAEQRSTADRIAGLERLHLEIGEREERIEALESDLKSAEEARDEALEEANRLQVEIVRLKNQVAAAEQRLAVLEGHDEALTDARARIAELDRRLGASTALEGEVKRLRKALDAERARAERISRRATETTPDTTYAMWDRVVRERVDAAVARDTGRLTEQIEHLRAVIAEKEARLRALTGGDTDSVVPDGPAETLNLPPITAIHGIGPRIAEILGERGIDSIPAIAALTDDDIDALADDMPVYPGRIRDDDWVGQAQALLRGDTIEPTEEALPPGPPPITAIKGIGPRIAAILADRGITSIEAVAALDDDEIDALATDMPVYPGRIRDDDWVGQARSFL